MKRPDFLSAALDAALAALMAIAGLGCLATGFGLSADMTTVALTAAGFAILAAIGTRIRKGWLLILLSLVLGAQLLWELDFLENLLPQLNLILSSYDSAYGWGVPESIREYTLVDATLTLSVLAAGCALLAGISLSQSWYLGAVLGALLPVIPCMVVTNTVPDAEYLWLGMLSVGVLTLTQHSRRTDARQANRLTAMVLIPVMLASILLFVRNPKSEYEAPDRGEGVFALMQKLAKYIPFMNMTPGGDYTIEIPGPAPDQVDLTGAGPRNQASSIALQVWASNAGVRYLRGRSYGDYTGKSWMGTTGEETLDQPGGDYTFTVNQTVRIWPQQPYRLQYVPYYPVPSVTLTDGMVEIRAADSYSYTFLPLRPDWRLRWNEDHGSLLLGDMDKYIDQQLAEYLALPESTADQARYHLKKAGVTGDHMFVRSTVDAIRDYVQNSAAYDLGTGYMPEWEADFALWFLENSDTGYCVHFATAATVLLRAAGIPARYVEGYLVETQAKRIVSVTTDNAHAWVEYYLPDVGWVILEATPEDGLPVTLPTEPTLPPETEPTEPTEPTQPTEPTEPTEPTLPTEPTAPTVPTRPTEPTVPTEPTQPTQPTTTTPAQTDPSEGSDPQPRPEPISRDWGGLLRTAGWIGLVLAAVLLVILQWRLRLWLRRRKMTGNAWAQVRARWRHACLLAKLCRHKPPTALRSLAEKAKFSQHTLSDRELWQFERYYAACIRGLRTRPWPLRLVYRLVLAAW